MRASDLYLAIDTILYDEWDPLGINDMEDARDEFRAYVNDIFELTTRRAGSASIAKQLFDIATYKMGVPTNMQHCREIADKIVALVYTGGPVLHYQ